MITALYQAPGVFAIRTVGNEGCTGDGRPLHQTNRALFDAFGPWLLAGLLAEGFTEEPRYPCLAERGCGAGDRWLAEPSGGWSGPVLLTSPEPFGLASRVALLTPHLPVFL